MTTKRPITFQADMALVDALVAFANRDGTRRKLSGVVRGLVRRGLAAAWAEMREPLPPVLRKPEPDRITGTEFHALLARTGTTRAEAARRLRVAPTTLYQYVKNGASTRVAETLRRMAAESDRRDDAEAAVASVRDTLTHVEIAARLGISVMTLDRYLKRGFPAALRPALLALPHGVQASGQPSTPRPCHPGAPAAGDMPLNGARSVRDVGVDCNGAEAG